jgi:hypothetical protein
VDIRRRPVFFLFLLSLSALVANAQTRVSDKDVVELMSNLKDDAKSFRPHFDSAIHQSTVRKTSQEKDAKNLANNLVDLTAAMLDNFKRTKKGDDFPVVKNIADQIGKLVSSLNLDSDTASRWKKISTEFDQVGAALGITTPTARPAATSAPAGSTPATCLQAVGAERAKQFVDQCMQVSPATHPPCNSQNACSMIYDEIKRGCGLLGAGAPDFCAAYK